MTSLRERGGRMDEEVSVVLCAYVSPRTAGLLLLGIVVFMSTSALDNIQLSIWIILIQVL